MFFLFVVALFVCLFFCMCCDASIVVTVFIAAHFAFCFTSCFVKLAFWSPSTDAHFAFCLIVVIKSSIGTQGEVG